MVTVSTPHDLTAVIRDGADLIAVAPGNYALQDKMCDDIGGAAVCIQQNVTIKAAVPGTVVLDAMQLRRVIHISGSSTFVQLIGLEITGGGGDTSYVRAPAVHFEPLTVCVVQRSLEFPTGSAPA
jgi:hypothetical protein